MDRVLRAERVTKIYREGDITNKVVNEVSLDIEKDDFVIIMGVSGSGKTSLLHLLAGIDNFDSGTISYKNQDFSHMKEIERAVFRRENIGIVFQQNCLIPDLTVYENLILPLVLNKKKHDKKSNKEKILNLCEKFNLKGHEGKYPSQLSGGQQQRASILRSIINEPELLLCDEPTGSLNSAQSQNVMDLLSELNRNGQTIVLVTHDIKVATRGNRIIYIEDGKISSATKFDEPYQQDTLAKREEEVMNFLKKMGW